MGLRYIELGLEKCSSCGQEFTDDKRLQVHHIDGDRANNSDSNTVILCRECHLDLHHPGRVWNKHFSKRLRNQGYTFEAIGKLLGITRQRVHQLCKT